MKYHALRPKEMSAIDINRDVRQISHRLLRIEVILEGEKIPGEKKKKLQKEAENLRERWEELKQACPHTVKDRLTGACSICG